MLMVWSMTWNGKKSRVNSLMFLLIKKHVEFYKILIWSLEKLGWFVGPALHHIMRSAAVAQKSSHVWSVSVCQQLPSSPYHPPSLTFPSCPLRLNPCHYQWQLRYWKAYITLRGCWMTICAAQLLSDPQMWWYACTGVWLHPSIDPSWDYYVSRSRLPHRPPLLRLLGPAETLCEAVTQQGSLLKPLPACARVRADTITPSFSLLAEHQERRVGMRWRSLLRKTPRGAGMEAATMRNLLADMRRMQSLVDWRLVELL